MGGRMASAYVAGYPGSGLAGLIVAGCRNNGGVPLSCKQNLEGVGLPVLDVWGDKNDKDSRAAWDRRSMKSETYEQIAIAGANHKFEGEESALVRVVTQWLEEQN
jgi:hypothetical protein